MRFQALNDDDWRLFLGWAAAEGWKVSFQEQCLFQNQWRPYFFALREDGKVRGFVSAVIYKESGWIGNLLVDRQMRGRGYGAELFDHALGLLQQSKLRRVWLTASEAGRPLYERRGFVAVDRVERWVGRGEGVVEPTAEQQLARLIELDGQCWGEPRAALLSILSDRAVYCRVGCSLALLQPGIDNWQLGPWLSAERQVRENRQLLAQAKEFTPAGRELLSDVLLSAEMELVLRNSGFRRTGSTVLMCLSKTTPQLDGVIALSSLGSIG